MPDFLIIGVQKGGSTMLKHNLSKLNSIYIPEKELHFFNTKYHKGITWYENNFKKHGNIILGEKTPNYITDNLYIDRIRKHYPNIKIIIILRNPILRAISHWNHFNLIESKSKKWGWIKKSNFTEGSQVNESILTNGLYAKQIEYVYQKFGSENVYICINEHFHSNGMSEFNKICDFLGVENNLTKFC